MMPSARAYCLVVFAILLMSLFRPAMSNGSRIDKIYHPYVQPLEREFEFRAIREDGASDSQGDRSIARLGYGQSINDNWFTQAYLIGDKNDDHSFNIRAFEMEGLWQLTEQGEYFADAGLLFDAESKFDGDLTELSSALLLEKEWGRWSGTANLYGIYEFGSDVNDEFESALNLQGRYRYRMYLEPAIELYKAQNTFGLGPVLLGDHPLSNARKLHWETGIVFGLDNDTPDRTIRALVEYEF